MVPFRKNLSRAVCGVVALFLTSLELRAADVSAQLEGKTVIKVEEDWVVDVGLADDISSAPEIVTVFGPDNPNAGLHAVFEMNHVTQPEFSRGGMQIQCWSGEALLGYKRHPNQSELLTVVERIQYTCRTSLDRDRNILRLEVRNGSSVTYGTFGGRELRLSLYSTRDDLNNYDANASIVHSRVTFGANRVNRFLRAEIRYYTSEGEIIVDGEDQVVHQLVEAEIGPPPVNP